TAVGQLWGVSLTPFDSDGSPLTPVSSPNTVTITAPTVSADLNNGIASLSTYADLTSQANGLGDPQAAYRWTVDGANLMILNMPFNDGVTQIDYSGAGNSGNFAGNSAFTVHGKAG